MLLSFTSIIHIVLGAGCWLLSSLFLSFFSHFHFSNCLCFNKCTTQMNTAWSHIFTPVKEFPVSSLICQAGWESFVCSPHNTLNSLQIDYLSFTLLFMLLRRWLLRLTTIYSGMGQCFIITDIAVGWGIDVFVNYLHIHRGILSFSIWLVVSLFVYLFVVLLLLLHRYCCCCCCRLSGEKSTKSDQSNVQFPFRIISSSLIFFSVCLIIHNGNGHCLC